MASFPPLLQNFLLEVHLKTQIYQSRVFLYGGIDESLEKQLRGPTPLAKDPVQQSGLEEVYAQYKAQISGIKKLQLTVVKRKSEQILERIQKFSQEKMSDESARAFTIDLEKSEKGFNQVRENWEKAWSEAKSLQDRVVELLPRNTSFQPIQ